MKKFTPAIVIQQKLKIVNFLSSLQLAMETIERAFYLKIKVVPTEIVLLLDYYQKVLQLYI